VQANRADAAPAVRARRRATKVPSRGAAVVQTDSKGEGRRCAHDLDGRTAAPSTRQFAVRAHSLPHLLSLSSAAVACDSLSTCATVPGHCYPRHWRDYRLQCTAECAVCIHSVRFNRGGQSRRLTDRFTFQESGARRGAPAATADRAGDAQPFEAYSGAFRTMVLWSEYRCGVSRAHNFRIDPCELTRADPINFSAFASELAVCRRKRNMRMQQTIVST
jgi:hypothetical protein